MTDLAATVRNTRSVPAYACGPHPTTNQVGGRRNCGTRSSTPASGGRGKLRTELILRFEDGSVVPWVERFEKGSGLARRLPARLPRRHRPPVDAGADARTRPAPRLPRAAASARLRGPTCPLYR